MTRFEKVIEAQRLLREVGDYDTAIAGAIGEVFAEEYLGMEKAPRGTAGIDGYIDGRTVSVKTREAHVRNRELFVDIRKDKDGLAEDLLC